MFNGALTHDSSQDWFDLETAESQSLESISQISQLEPDSLSSARWISSSQEALFDLSDHELNAVGYRTDAALESTINKPGSASHHLQQKYYSANATQSLLQIGRDSSLQCPYSGCPLSSGFTGQAELSRHISAKHTGQIRLFCPIVGCFRRSSRSSFARSDKLTAHIRAMHSPHCLCECVAPGCNSRDMESCDMYVHILGHFFAGPVEMDARMRAVFNGLSPAFCRCPIRRCGQNVQLLALCDHLLRHHEQSELALMRPELNKMNYLCTRLDCFHDPSEISNGGCPCPIAGIVVLCPICHSQCGNHQTFYEHLVEDHIIEDASHFHAWMEHVCDQLTEAGFDLPYSKKPENPAFGRAAWASTLRDPACTWKTWRFIVSGIGRVNLKVCCPVPDCGGSDDIYDGSPAAHHLSLLATDSRILSRRREILALFPDFSSHPVFDDLCPGQVDRTQVFRLKVNRRRIALKRLEDSLQGRDDPPSASDQLPLNKASAVETTFGRAESISGSSSSEKRQTSALTGELIGVGGWTRHRPDIRGPSEARSPSEFSAVSTDFGDSAYSDGDATSLHSEVRMLRQTTITAQASRTDRSTDIRNVGRGPSTADKRYSCDHAGCDFACEKLTDLRSHQRTHLDRKKRKYGCSQCAERFVYPKDLLRHHNSKHRSQVHACPFESCGKAIGRRDNLKRHLNRVHGVIDADK